jgi:hypothetical protein
MAYLSNGYRYFKNLIDFEQLRSKAKRNYHSQYVTVIFNTDFVKIV